MTSREIAARLLEVINDALVAAGRPHPRKFVSDGVVAYDWTPLLAVEWDRTEPLFDAVGEQPGSPMDMSSGNMPVRHVFTIVVTRESSFADEVGTPPTPAKVEASADVVLADAELVLEIVQRGGADSTLFGVCGQVGFISQTAIDGQGAVVGSATTISVAP